MEKNYIDIAWRLSQPDKEIGLTIYLPDETTVSSLAFRLISSARPSATCEKRAAFTVAALQSNTTASISSFSAKDPAYLLLLPNCSSRSSSVKPKHS